MVLRGASALPLRRTGAGGSSAPPRAWPTTARPCSARSSPTRTPTADYRTTRDAGHRKPDGRDRRLARLPALPLGSAQGPGTGPSPWPCRRPSSAATSGRSGPGRERAPVAHHQPAGGDGATHTRQRRGLSHHLPAPGGDPAPEPTCRCRSTSCALVRTRRWSTTWRPPRIGHGAGYYQPIRFDVHGALLSFAQFDALEHGAALNELTFQERNPTSPTAMGTAEFSLGPYAGVKAFLFMEDAAPGQADPWRPRNWPSCS